FSISANSVCCSPLTGGLGKPEPMGKLNEGWVGNALRPVVARLGPATLIVLMQVGQEGDVDELLAKIRDEIRALKRVGV
ncbi:hypothetical protein, partial [Pseudomonas sp. UBA6699]|uniref:hypothetical protein n=1 Tax=Pseudomonas sp. UBA6699 TaxID=1947333 RepID=UPI003BEEFE26